MFCVQSVLSSGAVMLWSRLHVSVCSFENFVCIVNVCVRVWGKSKHLDSLIDYLLFTLLFRSSHEQPVPTILSLKKSPVNNGLRNQNESHTPWMLYDGVVRHCLHCSNPYFPIYLPLIDYPYAAYMVVLCGWKILFSLFCWIKSTQMIVWLAVLILLGVIQLVVNSQTI